VKGLLFGPFYLGACLKQELSQLRFLPGTVGGGISKRRLQFVTSSALRLGGDGLGLISGPPPVSEGVCPKLLQGRFIGLCNLRLRLSDECRGHFSRF